MRKAYSQLAEVKYYAELYRDYRDGETKLIPNGNPISRVSLINGIKRAGYHYRLAVKLGPTK